MHQIGSSDQFKWLTCDIDSFCLLIKGLIIRFYNPRLSNMPLIYSRRCRSLPNANRATYIFSSLCSLHLARPIVHLWALSVWFSSFLPRLSLTHFKAHPSKECHSPWCLWLIGCGLIPVYCSSLSPLCPTLAEHRVGGGQGRLSKSECLTRMYAWGWGRPITTIHLHASSGMSG